MPSRWRRPTSGAGWQRSCGRRSPIRSPAASRCSGSSQRRGQVGLDGAEPDARRRRAPRPSDAAAGQDADQRCRSAVPATSPPWPSSRTRSQATSSPTSRSRSASRRSSSPSRSSRTRSNPRVARRRRKDQHGAAPAAGRRPEHQLQPRRPDQAAAARRTGAVAHRGHRRQVEAAIRRRGQPEAPAHPLSRNDHRVDRSARPAQEADRRPRPVRRLQGQVRAAAARQRFRVRRRHLRRLDSAAVHSGGRERASRTRACAASSPATRWSTSAPRSSTARSTPSTRTSCRSRWRRRWPSRTACHGRGRRCSSRSWTSRSTRRATTPAI